MESKRECSEKSLLDDFDISVREYRAHRLWRDEDELPSPGLSCCGDLYPGRGDQHMHFDARDRRDSLA